MLRKVSQALLVAAATFALLLTTRAMAQAGATDAVRQCSNSVCASPYSCGPLQGYTCCLRYDDVSGQWSCATNSCSGGCPPPVSPEE
jgi:hypothetical protein